MAAPPPIGRLGYTDPRCDSSGLFELFGKPGGVVRHQEGCDCDLRSARRRAVVGSSAGWQVTDSDFVTTDKELAEAVAEEFDRIERMEGP